MVRCSAPMCFNSSYKKPPNITFHRFSKDEQLRNAWLKNINKKDWQPKPSSVVCSKHFEVNLFEQSVFRTILAPGAIPTIFKNAEFQEKMVRTYKPKTERRNLDEERMKTAISYFEGSIY